MEKPAAAPAVILLAKGDVARRRATRAFMEVGGEYGVQWQFKRAFDGGVFIAHYPDELRETITFAILEWMQQRVEPFLAPRRDYVLNKWGQPLTQAQVDDFNAWRQSRLDEGIPQGGEDCAG